MAYGDIKIMRYPKFTYLTLKRVVSTKRQYILHKSEPNIYGKTVNYPKQNASDRNFKNSTGFG